ncbi:hypothetical protein TGAMA5MH_07204 [Trichoderma gamsii]|uniref:N-acetyltransferase ESCO zinc-finger domain-containing protein n=1 Tax=Trichoderma gamsii TaxID=398673 RepID=A0A2K0T5F9_9HYPO|nr:hypothetical protein TGAMA5MH_07204 [Trichoderma gamsii]
MVSSSPEFSITKPGLHLRKRDKPLRTYGRQTSTPEAQSEPPSKKARISAERERQQEEKFASALTSANGVTKSGDDAAIAGALDQDASAQNKAEKPGESLKKGSILSYFKPASQQVPVAAAPSQQLQVSPPEESSPPPQPSPKQPAKRKPRLLRIKTTTHEPSDQSSSSQETNDNPAPQKRRGRPPLKSNIISNTPEATSSSKDTTPSSSSVPSPTKHFATIKPKKNKPPSAAVQTTLNISAQAAFSECKICNTVWNPLYPDDVKYHIKTHKAVLRGEKKRKMDEL